MYITSDHSVSMRGLPTIRWLENMSILNYFSFTIKGGTGEGKQQPKEVKTDKVLPAYCNPPNPCPIGYTGTYYIYYKNGKQIP